jgi:hypothetical protein
MRLSPKKGTTSLITLESLAGISKTLISQKILAVIP